MFFIEHNKNGLIWMTSPIINTTHAFTTRYGGVSSGIFKSLNLGERRGDDENSVRENYNRICNVLGISPERLVYARQIHSTIVKPVTISDAHPPFAPVSYEADGFITDEYDLPLVVFTADCIPILLHDPVRHVIGAVHAGWRGTVNDIAGAAIRQMSSCFGCLPENVTAAIGPGIGLCCFETGPEVPEAVYRALGKFGDEFVSSVHENPDKFMVDLKGINRHLLERAGLIPENISVSDECTMCSHEKYWSHRYSCGKRGSQASIIVQKHP